MLDQSSARYKDVKNSPSQAAKIKNLDLFKNKIKEEIKKKNHYKSHLKPDSIKEYNKFSSEFRNFSLDMALLLLQDNAEVQTIKEKLIKLKNNTKGTHSIKSGKRTVYLQGEDIKAFEKRVERDIKYESMQCQVTYSKIEDSGDLLLHNVENAIYYIYHYFTKALDLQKKDGKKEAEKNKASEAVNSCEQTSLNEKKDNALENNSSNLSAKQDFLFDNTIDRNILSSIKGIDNSCQDSSIDSTNEITLLKEQVNQLSRENTQLKNNKNDRKQQINKDEINALHIFHIKSKNELEHKITQLQEQLADMESMKNIMSCMQEENRQLKKEAEENDFRKDEKIEHLVKENSLLSNKKSQPNKEAEEVKHLKSKLEEKDKQIEYLQKDIDDLAKENSKLVKAKRQLESVRDNSIDSDNRITQENTQLQNELKDIRQQLKKYESENNELQTKLQEFESKNKELEIEIRENKVQELEELKSTTNDLNTSLEKFEDIRAQLCEEIEELKQGLDNAQQNLTEKINELEGTKAQFAKLQQDLDMKTSEVIELKGRTNSAKQHLDAEIREFINIKAQLEKLQRELTKKTEELENVSKKLDDVNQKISQLEHERDDAQQQLKVLQNENKELKNKEASIVNTQGIKGQVNYTSASFILFGACAVGVSLTIPYLAACITLAIAASTFLVAGLYCSYKVNTALSDVKTDQQNKPLLESSI